MNPIIKSHCSFYVSNFHYNNLSLIPVYSLQLREYIDKKYIIKIIPVVQMKAFN